MAYVIFENPGEIDPLMIQTFGVSVKETDHPIGFFGTGLKYALAILLRTGHKVILQSGLNQHEFAVSERTIRGTPFRLVTMDDAPLGFTDQLGKTWEVWMAYRELYCNTKDENGSVDTAEAMPEPAENVTRFIVEGDEFLTQHRNREIFLLEGEPSLPDRGQGRALAGSAVRPFRAAGGGPCRRTADRNAGASRKECRPMIVEALHHLNKMLSLSPIVTVLLTALALSVMLSLLVAVTNRPSKEESDPWP